MVSSTHFSLSWGNLFSSKFKLQHVSDHVSKVFDVFGNFCSFLLQEPNFLFPSPPVNLSRFVIALHFIINDHFYYLQCF